ncbi:4623_t:CDS:1, partial [Cetraspora pellucida]
ILMNDEKSFEQIISEVVKKYIDEKDLKLFKLTDKYNPDFKRISLTDFANGNFQSVKKGGNTKVINFVTRMQDDYRIKIEPGRFYHYIVKHPSIQVYNKMWPCSNLTDKQTIDYLYYFKSLRDICAPLLKIEKEEAEQFLEVIYNENLKCSRQTTLVDLWNN